MVKVAARKAAKEKVVAGNDRYRVKRGGFDMSPVVHVGPPTVKGVNRQ
ncbi:MAG: hypothetical protein LUO89_05075 [Methanothrix sp.]|nr:hypothetical protein [Methanothrix sp.]